ncbi:unnamed protein product [Euphydryas editha]|uniref:3-oxoacyl-[acyl-carrier-protein] reductase FabG n=1 Tax=Euphydryas editha TaxID=104508 RepID=A0AAU9U2K8_EUPED|nr:unnamed protein product [Euphydryas editha]
MSFKNKVVIITGASSGIGAAAAKMFSDEGARVVMVGRNETKLSAVAKQCSSPLVIRADIANDDDARRVINETINNYGKIDILVNNAGMTMQNGGLLGSDMMQSYDTITKINIRAPVHLTSLAAPHLIKTKGNVVNVSSVAAVKAPAGPGHTNYFISKAALNHFTVCAAVELGGYGVRVNTLSPGPVKTDFFENAKSTTDVESFRPLTILNRVSEPEEMADLVLYLASDRARGVTGSNYINDNGMIIKKA